MSRCSCSFALTAMVLAGCTSIPVRPGFDTVQQAVADRLPHSLHWRQGGAEDAAVDRQIDGLLSEPLSVESAVQISLLNNRQLQATYEQLGVSQAMLVQAGLLRNPVFAGSAGFLIDGGQVELGLGVAQDFLDIFNVPLRKAIAEAEFETAQWAVAAAVLDIAAATERAFYQTQADAQLLEMFEQVVAATAASSQAAGQLHEAGNITRLDYLNERALHEQAKASLAAAHSVHQQHRERLGALMGLWGERMQWTMARRLPEIGGDEPDLDSIERVAVTSSIDLAMASSRLTGQARRLGFAQATSLFSDLDLGVAVEREEGEWEVGPTLEVTVPLFDQGTTRVAAARAAMKREFERLYALAVEVRSQARAARDRLVAVRRLATFYRDQMLPLREQITQETLLQYNAMQVGVFDLLLARQRQIEAGQRYVESLRDYWLARSRYLTIRNGRLTRPDDEAAPFQPPEELMATATGVGGH